MKPHIMSIIKTLSYVYIILIGGSILYDKIDYLKFLISTFSFINSMILVTILQIICILLIFAYPVTEKYLWQKHKQALGTFACLGVIILMLIQYLDIFYLFMQGISLSGLPLGIIINPFLIYSPLFIFPIVTKFWKEQGQTKVEKLQQKINSVGK